MNTHRRWTALPGAALALGWLGLSGCSSDEPSFNEQRTEKKVNVAVEAHREKSADATTSDAVPAAMDGDVNDILDSAGEPEIATEDAPSIWTSDTVEPSDSTSGEAGPTDEDADEEPQDGSTGGDATDTATTDPVDPGSETLGDIPEDSPGQGHGKGHDKKDDGDEVASGDDVEEEDPATDTDGAADGTADGSTPTDDGVAGDGVPSDDGVAGDGEPTDDNVAGDGEPADDNVAGDGEPADDGSTGDEVADEGDTGDANDPDLNACAKLMGVNASRIKIAGNQPNVKIESDSVMAVKVTGNEATLDLTLIASEAAAKLAGLCVFLAGNQADVKIQLAVDVGRLVYIGRGNKSHCDVQVQEDVVLDELIGDLAGNQSALNLWGRGAYSCGIVRHRGHDTQYTCN